MTAHEPITRSKIVCTLGPSSHTVEQVRRLAELGMDCARINFSHGTEEDRAGLFHNAREADGRLAILCDIQGPKIRIGRMKEGGVILHPGSRVVITTEDHTGDENRIPVYYGRLPQEVRAGDPVFVNDGLVRLRVQEARENEVLCEVVNGGPVSTHKGVNLPHTKISLKVPTPKDVEDLRLIARLGPEYVAVSFVEDAGDMETIRGILSAHGNDRVKLIAKIERPVALENFHAILGASDGIMVARGDLGVELPPEEVIPVQKELIKKCNVEGKPVIVATQMLESMVRSPVPTRAEVSDVYNAIADGSDAVMLSAETASGEFPAEAVDVMRRIIRVSESLLPTRDPDDYDSEHETVSEIIGHMVFSACREMAAVECGVEREGKEGKRDGKIVCITRSGYTARMISKYRPSLPILGITPDAVVAREMKLVWGVEPLPNPALEGIEDAMSRVKVSVKACFEQGCIEDGEMLVVAGNIFNLPSQTNMVSIFSAGDLLKMA